MSKPFTGQCCNRYVREIVVSTHLTWRYHFSTHSRIFHTSEQLVTGPITTITLDRCFDTIDKYFAKINEPRTFVFIIVTRR